MEHVVWRVAGVSIVEKGKCNVSVVGQSLSIHNQTSFSHSFSFPLNVVLEKDILPGKHYKGIIREHNCSIYFEYEADQDIIKNAFEMQRGR